MTRRSQSCPPVLGHHPRGRSAPGYRAKSTLHVARQPRDRPIILQCLSWRMPIRWRGLLPRPTSRSSLPPKNQLLRIRKLKPSGKPSSNFLSPCAAARVFPPGLNSSRAASLRAPPSPSWYPTPTPPTTSTRTSARISCTCGASAQATTTLSSRSPRTSPPAFALSSMLTHNTDKHSALSTYTYRLLLVLLSRFWFCCCDAGGLGPV